MTRPESRTRTLRVAMAVLAGALALPALAQAQGDARPYPAKPIRYMVGSAVGGNTDIVSRIVAEGLTRNLGQQVFVENRAGAMQIPAISFVARAPADGYTLLGTGIIFTTNAALYNDLPYDSAKDFAAAGFIGSTPILVVVHPSLPVNSIEELVAYARARPGVLNYGSTGVGSPAHLGGELFKSLAGVDLVHVPYKGTAQSVSDVATGVLQTGFVAAGSIQSLLKTGKLRVLGIGSARRSPRMKEIRPVTESLPGYGVQLWNGVQVPAGTPRAVIARINTELNKTIESPDIREKLEKIDMDVESHTPEETAAYIDAEIRKWIKLVREVGIKGER